MKARVKKPVRARLKGLVFEGSDREVNFDEFWNRTIVVCDIKIKAHFLEGTVFFPPLDEVNARILDYLEALNSLISNVLRMCEGYTDPLYVQAYIRRCVEDASEDFFQYKSIIIGKKWNITAFESTIEKAHPLFKEALVARGVIPKPDPFCPCHISPTC